MQSETEVRYSIEREATGIECQCGGYAVQVDTTAEESEKYGCGGYDCCSRAFVCKVCGARIVGNAKAPEMR